MDVNKLPVKALALVSCLLMFGLAGCSSVTMQPEYRAAVSGSPSYQKRKHFYLGGLVGERRVDVKQICGDRKVIQMQSQQTFVDGLLGLITIGIYAPHSVKVWCE